HSSSPWSSTSERDTGRRLAALLFPRSTIWPRSRSLNASSSFARRDSNGGWRGCHRDVRFSSAEGESAQGSDPSGRGHLSSPEVRSAKAVSRGVWDRRVHRAREITLRARPVGRGPEDATGWPHPNRADGGYDGPDGRLLHSRRRAPVH